MLNHPSIFCRNIDEYISLLNTQTPTDLLLKNNPELSTYMFDIGAQIQRLACACLTIVHDIFDSVFYPDSDSTPTSEEDLHDATYSFSRVKKYRAYRALWYMWYHSDLHGALNQWHWPSESIYRLSEPVIMLHVMESFIVYPIWRAEWCWNAWGCVASLHHAGFAPGEAH